MTPNHQSDYSLSLPFKAMPSMMARVKFSLVAGFILMGIPNLPLWKHSFNELGGFAAIIHPQWIEFYVACIVGFGFFMFVLSIVPMATLKEDHLTVPKNQSRIDIYYKDIIAITDKQFLGIIPYLYIQEKDPGIAGNGYLLWFKSYDNHQAIRRFLEQKSGRISNKI